MTIKYAISATNEHLSNVRRQITNKQERVNEILKEIETLKKDEEELNAELKNLLLLEKVQNNIKEFKTI